MKIKRLLAAILSALMITSAFSFVASANEEAELAATGVLSQFDGSVGGYDGGTAGKNATRTKLYDAVNNIVFHRIQLTADGTKHWNVFGFPNAPVTIDTDDKTVNAAYMMRTPVGAKTPSGNLWQAKHDGSTSNSGGTFTGPAIVGDGNWEVAQLIIGPVADTLVSFGQVQTFLAGPGILKAGDYFDVAYAAFANDADSAITTVQDKTKYDLDGITISFNLNYDSAENLDEYPTEIPDRKADGYLFEGWATTADATVAEYTDLTCVAVPTANTTYYAVWGDLIEAENAVYISADGDDANGGRHSKDAVKTLQKANELLAGEGIDTLYVIGNVDGTGTPGLASKRIYIKGYSGTGTEVISHTSHWKFAGDVEFSNIVLLDSDAGDGQFVAQGHNITINDTATTTKGHYLSQAYYYGNLNNINSTVTVNGGTWTMYPGTFSSGTTTGKMTWNIGENAVINNIYAGHNDGTHTKGEIYINLNGGTIGTVNLKRTGNNSVTGTGLRYFTFNDGTVGTVYTRASGTSTDLAGVTVFEFNEDAEYTAESILESETGADDSETRVVIFNDGFDAKTVADTGAIVLDVTGGKVSADVTVAEDYTATLNKFTFTTTNEEYDQVTIKAGDATATYKLADLSGEIALDKLTAGTANEITFSKYVEAPTTADYTIKTYTMGTDGAYGEAVKETKTAEIGSTATYTPVAEAGFVVNNERSTLSGKVEADGSLTLAVYYDRNQYKLYTKADADAEAVEAGTYYYEEAVTAPADPTKAGYTFAGWDMEIPVTMPGENITITAMWTATPRTFENAVYVGDAGNDENNGLTPTTLVKTLKAAQTIILANEDIDKIVIVTKYSKTNDGAALDDYLKGAGRKITITGYDADSVFDARYIVDGSNKDSHFRFAADVEINNIKLYGSSKDGGFMSQGYELTFGEGITLVGGSQNVGFLHYNAQLKDNGVVNLMSGSYNKIDLAVQSGQTWKGTSTINISGTASTKITNGHGWQGTQAVYGINNVNINGGNVSSIQLSATADTAVTNYAGLRYYTINAGTVGNIYTTGSSVSKKYTPTGGTETYKTASARAGVTVFEINGGTVGTIALGTNKQTGEADPDDATRVVILNNGMTATVSDTGAIVVKATGAKLHAATNAQETYPTDYKTIDANWGKAIVLKGFTYELPENSTANAVKVDGGEAVLLTDLVDGVIAGITTAGEHTVEFVYAAPAVVNNKVYLGNGGNDEADGLTATTPVKTLAKAHEIIADDENIDTIVIVGTYTTATDGEQLGVAGRTLTVTGADANAVFDYDANKTGTDDDLVLASPIIFKNIALRDGSGDGVMQLCGNAVIFDEGVTVNSGAYIEVAGWSGSPNNIHIKSGEFGRILPGSVSGSYSGTTNITVDGGDIKTAIVMGHGWRGQATFNGTVNAVINDGNVASITMNSNGDSAAVAYKGLRYFTLNGGTVGSITTTEGSQYKNNGNNGNNRQDVAVSYREGVTVFEINKAGIVTGTIALGNNAVTGQPEADNATRIILFNNGSYEADKVTDDGAITVDVQNGALKADVTVAADYQATLNGYTFTTDKKLVYINGAKHEVSEFVADAALAADEVSGIIPVNQFAEGNNTVVFSDADIVNVTWEVNGEIVQTDEVEVGAALTAPTATKAPNKNYYYTLKAWNDGTADIADIAAYTAPEGGAALVAVFNEIEMPKTAVKDFDRVYAMNSGKEFSSVMETIDGVEAAKAVYSEDTAEHTDYLTFEGWNGWPTNHSVNGQANHVSGAIYNYVVVKYYYVPGTNTDARNIVLKTMGIGSEDAVSMDTNKWSYAVYDITSDKVSNQYHLKAMSGVNIGTLKANNEVIYVDTMTLFQDAPTVATVTFKGEDGTVLYAIDALNSEAVTFNGTDPEKDNYTFKGWAKEGTTAVVEAFTFAEDTTLVPVFEKDEEVIPTNSATYKTYGVYDEEAGTYTIELKLSGVKAHMGSFGFILPTDSLTVTPNTEAGISLFAEEAADGAIVSPIFNNEYFYANTWAVEAVPGYIDATKEEVLIATFVYDMDEDGRAELVESLDLNGKLSEGVVENADEKYYKDGHYLAAPKSDSLDTEKVAIYYVSHTDSVKEAPVATYEYKTYGTYNPAAGTYTIDVAFKGGKINAGAFGIAFDSDYMTYDPEATDAFKFADGISNYLGIMPQNTAGGVAFIWDGSADAENGYVDATEEEVIIATITAKMTADQRAAYVEANKPAFEILDISEVEGSDKLFNGTDYLVSVYEDDLNVERVAAKYTAHTDDEVVIENVDVTVKVTFAGKEGATTVNLGYLTIGDNAPIVIDAAGNEEETVEYVIKDAKVGETISIAAEKNGYIAAGTDYTVNASANVIEFTLVAGDIKESTVAICGNGEVELSDFIRVVRAFDEAATDDYKATVDINEDGTANVTDLNIIKSNFGKTAAETVIIYNGEASQM